MFRHLKTEPPFENAMKEVVDVVAVTMRELVAEAEQDVFVLFYKPGCHHCQDFMPTWVSLLIYVHSVKQVLNSSNPYKKGNIFVKNS